MQTFLPYSDFTKSAQCLDNRRLGKQRVECLQILNTLSKRRFTCPSCKQGRDNSTCADCQEKCRVTPWYNHPAVKMWKGYEISLAAYGVIICNEWIKRGWDDTCKEKILPYLYKTTGSLVDPPWLGNKIFHASHRSNLLRKDFDYYAQFNWTEPTTLEYVWPVK